MFNYIPARICTFRPDIPLTFDVYVHFQEQYVKYKGTSHTFEETSLLKLREKNVKKLFIRLQDEELYLQYLENALDQLQAATIPTNERALFAQETLLSEAENIEKSLDTVASYERAQGRIDKVFLFLCSEPTALKQILAAAGISEEEAQHGANVATLSLSLAARLGVTDPQEIQALGFASLLHDIGKKKLNFHGVKPLSDMTSDEKRLYLQHPQVGVELVAGKKFVTPKVLRLILDHEEWGEGEGFPQKKRISKLHLISQILNLCNDFDRFCRMQGQSAIEALNDYVSQRGKLFDGEHVKVLAALLRSN